MQYHYLDNRYIIPCKSNQMNDLKNRLLKSLLTLNVMGFKTYNSYIYSYDQKFYIMFFLLKKDQIML